MLFIKHLCSLRHRRRGGMGTLQDRFKCNRQCYNSHVRHLCGVCLPRLNQAFQENGDAKKKVHFLQAYEPGPLSEFFRGDVTLVGCDLVPVFAHRFIMSLYSQIENSSIFSWKSCYRGRRVS
ncbi:hypothetical protein MPTK1_8g07400 [Marchantia polymorpha subsp. ruderalis]|uniref:Uncharacterized protein n=1 Tax=Marchantia polymorpha TaxID=3197 RepID=A0A2R6XI86_MARPO|nr:hypothetical protein MARPO_0013s0053 [Marchantia polymorpha]BBN19025.1 hypothetical protein Mp_8g07400 [Marchantia polymorpha subsp. ruderalis]|eukprot:PTQ45821.1 hypothetical protein MARPO_0013s0053 [Marchantia polymorpha]